MNVKKKAPEGANQIKHSQYKPGTPFSERKVLAAKSLNGLRRRVFTYIDATGRPTTAEIAANCACGNVSDAVLRMNPELAGYGIEIAHRYAGIPNRYGEHCPMHWWWIVDVEAAND